MLPLATNDACFNLTTDNSPTLGGIQYREPTSARLYTKDLAQAGSFFGVVFGMTLRRDELGMGDLTAIPLIRANPLYPPDRR